MRDVRQLGILGFNVPVGIKKCADLAKMFSKQAKDLQQVIALVAVWLSIHLFFFGNL